MGKRKNQQLMLTTIDCWGTVLKPSPAFLPEKITLTKKFFPSLETADIYNAFEKTKKIFNKVVEGTGMQPKREDIFQYLFTKLAKKYIRLPLMERYMEEYEQLALRNPPTLYSDETARYLRCLKSISHLAISSNTLFLSGQTLIKMLRFEGVADDFFTFYFSDELGVAKPHPRMYMRSKFHIGDNQITDYEGPLAAKSTPFLINSNKQTIKDAYNFIAQSIAIRA